MERTQKRSPSEEIYSGFLNGFALKLIATITMFIDHMGAGIFKSSLSLRIIGRVAFPIFCFLLVEGFHKSRNKIGYLGRLMTFALISEVPFDLLFKNKLLDLSHQNVYFTLSLGLVMLMLISEENNIFLQLVEITAISLIAFQIGADYRHYGILMIAFFELFRKMRPFCVWTTSRVMYWDSPLELYGALAHIPICLYNGKRGWDGLKWFFYFFYPGHLLFLYIVRRLFFKQ